MSYELIAFDLDGTLLASDKSVLPSSVVSIDEAVAAGKAVAISSGRSPSMVTIYRDILPGIRYAICSAGAIVYDLMEDRALYCHPLDHELVEKVIRTSDEAAGAGNYILKIGTPDAVYMEEREIAMCERCGIGVYEDLLRSINVPVEDAHAVALDPSTTVCKMVLHFPEVELRDRVYGALRAEDLMISACEVSSVEFTAAGVNKGSALQRLAQILGLDISQTIAVGDAENDLAMIRAAGLGVAMGNALPAVVEAAGTKVADCDHGGCAEAIRRFLLAE